MSKSKKTLLLGKQSWLGRRFWTAFSRHTTFECLRADHTLSPEILIFKKRCSSFFVVPVTKHGKIFILTQIGGIAASSSRAGRIQHRIELYPYRNTPKSVTKNVFILKSNWNSKFPSSNWSDTTPLTLESLQPQQSCPRECWKPSWGNWCPARSP